MKVAVIGAAGVRSPQLIKRLLQSNKTLGLREVALMDIDEHRLSLMKTVIDDIVEVPNGIDLTITADLSEACRNASFVIFTMRVGNTEARIFDEKIPLRFGVLGQETTGPGGFAMALRTIPVVLDYMHSIQSVAPEAWVINLTNPSGLITQAITDHGYTNIVGICDGPTELFAAVSRATGHSLDELWFDYYGINHLGWIGGVKYQGKEILPSILVDDDALATIQEHSVDSDLMKAIGAIPNEYLIFYYKNRSVVENIKNAAITRSEQILAIDSTLFEQLADIQSGKSPERPREAYLRYMRERSNSYFQVERQGYMDDRPLVDSDEQSEMEPEGYSEIAVQVLEALAGAKPQVIAVNVVNQGALPCLALDDVVEVPSLVDKNGLHPFCVSVAVPTHAETLLRRVKGYERLTIEAAKTNSFQLALQALSSHPLIPDLTTAKTILQCYIEANGSQFPRLE